MNQTNTSQNITTEGLNKPICPLCKSKKAKLDFIKFNYSIFDCQSCKSLYVYPSPSSVELEQFYTSGDQEKLSQVCWTDVAESHKHVWDVWKEGLEYIEKQAGRGPLLDIGCGTGQFLVFAKQHGWTELKGIELNQRVAKIAGELSGGVIYTSELLKTSLPSASFSGIVLWDTIEHLNDIESALKEVFRLLKPGGVVLIGTVNRSGVSVRLLNKNALTVNPPEHLIFFTQKGMAQALKLAGFEVCKIWSFSIYLREWLNYFSKIKPSQKTEDDNDTDYRSKVNDSTAFLMLMKIANAFLKVTNLGDELVAIGQKR
ncbi:class I SAM-dependent methyltransferase [Crocosphaera sp. XPORK-15E]|uniref:class I SAM-dependent methyltransferase n=1 Tax=Crocosphaera sp. XPORK-15E TaxID=3110247 RepID=UPI002B1FABCF|nr:class I SAM-dependent methyltransferase [Crocosphaera sp. XPORK-15E]MEA5536084.1 class I SAM-dependent methyltransferase [Crocosphaera sp. XPORK-15E]